MKKIKAWGLKKCDTTMKAVDYIKAQEVEVLFTDYSVDKPSVAQIEKWAKAVGGWEKLINRSGYTWRGLDPSETQDLDDKKAAKLAAAHTSLIRRPLIEHEDGSVTAGFPPKVKALF
jgi:arsenate reductase (glutaredoxin)